MLKNECIPLIVAITFFLFFAIPISENIAEDSYTIIFDKNLLNNPINNLNGSKSLGQTFFTDKKFDTIDLFLNLKIDNTSNVYFHLREYGGKNDIVLKKIQIEPILNNSNNIIRFKCVVPKKVTGYEFFLDFKTNPCDGLLNLSANSDSIHSNKYILINRSPIQGDLNFRVMKKFEGIWWVDRILKIIYSDIAFFTCYTLIILLIIIGLVVSIKKEKK